jgi:hypothetical protein
MQRQCTHPLRKQKGTSLRLTKRGLTYLRASFLNKIWKQGGGRRRQGEELDKAELDFYLQEDELDDALWDFYMPEAIHPFSRFSTTIKAHTDDVLLALYLNGCHDTLLRRRGGGAVGGP